MALTPQHFQKNSDRIFLDTATTAGDETEDTGETKIESVLDDPDCLVHVNNNYHRKKRWWNLFGHARERFELELEAGSSESTEMFGTSPSCIGAHTLEQATATQQPIDGGRNQQREDDKNEASNHEIAGAAAAACINNPDGEPNLPLSIEKVEDAIEEDCQKRDSLAETKSSSWLQPWKLFGKSRRQREALETSEYEPQIDSDQANEDDNIACKGDEGRPISILEKTLSFIPTPFPKSSVQLKKRSESTLGGTTLLLYGCMDQEEHFAKIDYIRELAKTKRGKDGLKAAGFEFQCVEDDDSKTLNYITRLFHIESNTMVDTLNRKRFIADGDMYDAVASLCQDYAHELMQSRYGLKWVTICSDLGDNPQYPRAPIQALVNAEHPLALHNPLDESNDDIRASKTENELPSSFQRPTVLIVTGRGKVRAGIFSRQHLMTSGVEISTALPLIREAKIRQLNVVILDPNVHGDYYGMVTFEKSMARLFQLWEDPSHYQYYSASNIALESASRQDHNRDLYILCHSASGAQFNRYMLEKHPFYLPHIRAIAFTDSNHSIQWARKRQQDDLGDLLESPRCIYFRVGGSNSNKSNPRNREKLDAASTAGQPAVTDDQWKYRFGKIRTVWAGTNEHSLTNWFAHGHIWEHFDRHLLNSEHGTQDTLSAT